jgi:RNA polymerase sigma factor (sigma-70 family)
MMYVVVPPELAGRLHEPLREHFRGDRTTQVVVDRRPPPGTVRPVIHDRWPQTASETPPALPEFALPYRERIAFRYLPQLRTLANSDVETASLVARFQAGETGTLEVLYTRYFDHVYGGLRVAVDDPEEAEKLTHQTWHRVDRRLGRFEPADVPFRRWLLGVAREVLLDELARRGRLSVAPTESTGASGTSRAAVGVGERWFGDEELRDTIEQLSLRHREVLVLHYFLDLSYFEIAGVTSTSAEVARQLHTQARHELDRRLHASCGQDRPSSGASERLPMRRRSTELPVLYARRQPVAGVRELAWRPR